MAFVHDTFFLVAAVVGGVLGGAIATIFIVVFVLCIWKHKKFEKHIVCRAILVLCIHTIHAHDNYICFLPRLLSAMS